MTTFNEWLAEEMRNPEFASGFQYWSEIWKAELIRAKATTGKLGRGGRRNRKRRRARSRQP